MTAGRGLVHAEVSPDDFMRRGGRLEILQLWVNLPSRLKMTAPRYVGLQQAEIPAFVEDGGRVIVEPVSGIWSGRAGPIPSLIDVHMATLRFAPGGRLRVPASPGRTIFLYVVRGGIHVGGTTAAPFNLVEMNDDGAVVELSATADALVLLGHAAPLGEPVVAYGPFVMNTRDEISEAIRDFQAGRLGDLPS